MRPTFSPDSSAEYKDLGDLPDWRLDDLYPGQDSNQLKADQEKVQAEAKEFRKEFEGKLAGLSGGQLAQAIRRYEAIEEILGRLMSYAQLLYNSDLSNAEVGRFYQSMQEKVTAVSSQLLFFTLEINKISEDDLKAKLEDPELARYAPWLRDTRAFRPFQLSEELERLLHEKQVSGRAAWTRLFDETMAGLRFPFEGKMVTESQILNKLSDKKEETRKKAAKSLASVLRDNLRLFAQVTNTLAKDKAIEDDWRGHKRPVSSRNLANMVEDEVVDALASSVTEAFPRLSHRYFKLKAKWFGKERLDYWDRNAPLPQDIDRKIPWSEAEKQVLTAYNAFSPDLAEIGKRFFKENWIDAAVKPGKSSGAFSHPTVPSAHPYILMNYQGRVRDVMTLAHELGHGVHQVLSGRQGYLMADTPLTLAETASVFGEMLTFQSLLREESDPARRKVMLAGKVEDMLNTVVRQIAFHNFETRLHDERREGELLADRICDIWMETQSESFGDAIRLDEDYRVFWSYIPHFIHVPFYVYAYAFGDCLVNSLYAVYQEAEEGFSAKYLEMLKAGGSKRHKELLAPFGLDASDPAFWSKGLGVVEGMIDELEKLDAAGK
ncbi:M3 family oligoendopeptidase [Limibacillus halophilus]